MATTIPDYIEGGYSPEQLKNLRHLEGFAPYWFWGRRGDKNPQNPEGGSGSTDDPATAGTLAQALAAMKRKKGGTVGLLISASSPGLVGCDIDNVVSAGGEIHPLGLEAIKRFAGAYAELSPSRTGLRIFCTGIVPADTPKGSTAVGDGIKFEAYTHGGAGRWLRMTGALIPSTAGAVAPCQDGIDWLAGVMTAAKGSAAPSPDKGAAGGKVSPGVLSLDDVLAALAELRPEKGSGEVIEAVKAKAASEPRGKLADAWRGNKAPWKDDHSTADLFMCCEAIRRGAGHVEDVVSVWAESALSQRDKFKRKDYRIGTIERAARAVLSDLQAKPDKAEKPKPQQLPDGLRAALALSGDKLAYTKTGRLEAEPGNVVVLFRNDPSLSGLLAFNELAQAAERRGSWQFFDRGAADKAGPLADDCITRVGMWLAREYCMKMDRRELLQGLEAAARDAAYDPLANRLRELRDTWDGVPRVDSWLEKFAMVDTADSAEYVSTVGRCFLVGAVARALSPGCQMDTVLAVEGKGGGGKSTMFRLLAEAVAPDLFADGVHDVSSTAALIEGTGGRWIVELAELAGVRRAADVEALKAALTRTSDSYRRPYDVRPRTSPRRFVFVATTNRTEYLSDPSGALLRRFWPVRTLSTETNPIDREALASVAGQLWGEAVRMFEAGAKWHLEESDGAAFKQWTAGRELRREDGAFHEELVTYLAEWVPDYFASPTGSGRRLKDIGKAVGDLRTVDGDQAACNRLGDTLRGLGMESIKRGGLKKWFFSAEAARRAQVMREQA